jgi:hypothetical protein
MSPVEGEFRTASPNIGRFLLSKKRLRINYGKLPLPNVQHKRVMPFIIVVLK